MLLNDAIDITVLMPVYNVGKYVAEAIQSVLDQSFESFELLIINDGSTDDTETKIKLFTDPRIVMVNRQHAGVAMALNAGIQLARGRYIARFDADDICLPDRLEKQFRFLEQHPDHVLTGSDALYIQESGEPLFTFHCWGHSDADIQRNLYTFCPAIHSAVMVRKKTLVLAGGYDVKAHNFEDYLLWVRIARMGKLANIPEPLIKVRFNPSSITIDEKWRGKRFRQLKRTIIQRGRVNDDEERELVSILTKQDTRGIKVGAYHVLCGKKMLTDNHQPAKARTHIWEAIKHQPFRWDSYALLGLSFLPKAMIDWLHYKSPNRL